MHMRKYQSISRQKDLLQSLISYLSQHLQKSEAAYAHLKHLRGQMEDNMANTYEGGWHRHARTLWRCQRDHLAQCR